MMALLTSIIDEKFRKNFCLFFILSSTIPMLFMIFLIFQYVIPVLTPNQTTGLRVIFTYGVLGMLVPVFLSFALGFFSVFSAGFASNADGMRLKTVSAHNPGKISTS